MDVEYISMWYLLSACLHWQWWLLRSLWLRIVEIGSHASGQCDSEGTQKGFKFALMDNENLDNSERSPDISAT